MHISLAAEALFYIGSFPVTNTLIMGWLTVLLVLAFSLLLTRKLQTVPGGMQNVTEVVVGGALQFVEDVLGDKSDARRFFPVVFTIFVFVILSNWIELVPGLGTIGIREHGALVPFIRATSADLNFTLAIAVCSVVAVQFFGITTIGFFKYVGKFINFKDGPIMFFVGILELISEISRLISYSFRLFGNIFAGEVLLTVILFLVPYVVPLPFLFLEIFVGFIQALVFSMLTLVFLKIATAEHH